MEQLSISSTRKSALASLMGFITLVTLVVVGSSWSGASGDSSTLGPSNAWRQHYALAAAKKLLAAAPLPAGAKLLTTYDASYKSELGQPSQTSGDPDQVDQTRFYRVAGGASAEASISHFIFEGHAPSTTGSGSGPGEPVTETIGFSPTGNAILPTPSLLYTMVIITSGDLEFRVDASEAWTPRKSQYSLVAPGATKLIVTAHPRNGSATVLPSYSGTTSNPTVVNDVRLKVNDLPAAYPGVRFCPLDVGATLTLSFFRAGASSPYATVTSDPGGCGVTTITQFDAGGAKVGSTTVSGGSVFTTYVTHAMGMKRLVDAPSPVA